MLKFAYKLKLVSGWTLLACFSKPWELWKSFPLFVSSEDLAYVSSSAQETPSDLMYIFDS